MRCSRAHSRTLGFYEWRDSLRRRTTVQSLWTDMENSTTQVAGFSMNGGTACLGKLQYSHYGQIWRTAQGHGLAGKEREWFGTSFTALIEFPRCMNKLSCLDGETWVVETKTATRDLNRVSSADTQPIIIIPISSPLRILSNQQQQQKHSFINNISIHSMYHLNC